MGTTARTLGLVLGGWLIGGSAHADAGPEQIDRGQEPVEVDINVDDVGYDHVLVLSPVACNDPTDADYVVITDKTGVVERRVGDDEVPECEPQTLYALPSERFPVVDGKLPALDALTADERKAVLADRELPSFELAEAWWWVPVMVFIRHIRASYRVQRDDEGALELVLLRYDLFYSDAPMLRLCPGELDPLRFEEEREPTAPWPYERPTPKAAACPTCPACPVVAAPEPSTPAPAIYATTPPLATTPAPAADPPAEIAAPTRALDPNLERVLLGVTCLVIGGLAGLRLRRKG
jgi:hypothetical protein